MSEEREIFRRAMASYRLLEIEGLPYLWGGNVEKHRASDCSGVMIYVYNRVGFSLPDQRARDLEAMCIRFGNAQQAKIGDLAFYGRGYARHVVMVMAPKGELVMGANGGHSFDWAGIDADMPEELSLEEMDAYRTKMDELGACVRMETRGYNYRRGFRCFGRMPLDRLLEA